MPENYLTIDDVAKILKIDAQTVRKLVNKGELNAFKVGNQIRFKESDVANVLKPVSPKWLPNG